MGYTIVVVDKQTLNLNKGDVSYVNW